MPKYVLLALGVIIFIALVFSIGISWESIAAVAIVMAIAIYIFTRK